jgi:type II secretory ATPase GspE/PulE/Tfp pilus assembly ATPase PilB-like protein
MGLRRAQSDIHIVPQRRAWCCGFARRRRLTHRKLALETDSAALASRLEIPFATRYFRNEECRRTPHIDQNRRPDHRLPRFDRAREFGEKIVMRILDKTSSLMPLDKIIVHMPTVEKYAG